ncbi:MAG TPA: response regulator [Nitrospira sp.]|nr:response regulator [Nitrospira sp.]
MIKSKVLVVDDEESIRNLVKAVLTREGREVLLSSRGQDAIEMFRRERPDITILDIAMPDLNGIEVLRRIRAVDQGATVMVFTGFSTETSVRQARELGVTEFIEKGSSLASLGETRTRRL